MIKQLGKSDCILACIAMAANKTYAECFSNEFIEKIQTLKGCHGDMIDTAFKTAGFEKDKDYKKIYTFNKDIYLIRPLLWGRKAIFQVPSLNYPDTEHAIFCTNAGEILDPSTLQTYTNLNQIFPTYTWVFN